MAKQIEGAQPSFVSRMMSKVVAQTKVGTVPYSLAYGAAAGIALSGLVYVGRTMNILLFDHTYYKIQSRHRYYEKQLLFTRELEESQQAHRLAALAAEYNPAAIRMPFQKLAPKY